MTIRLVEESCELTGAKLSVSILSLENATLVLVTDKRNQYRIGTVALAMPITGRTGEAPPSILTLFGSGGGLLAKALAGRISNRTGKTVLSIVGLMDDDLGTVSSILRVSERILEKMSST
ncbi:MAG: hypothetical protein WED04_03340 [Promethearchaeati archaeon SRVP18_Atabeyarchaeia-1]